jgi:hypothetical protein
VRRCLPLIAAVAVAVTASACGDDTPDPIPVTETEACKAVKEKLKLEAMEERFGEPDGSQDFFGDRVLTYDDDEVKWQFQVSTQAGTYRALRVEGKGEKVLDCQT